MFKLNFIICMLFSVCIYANKLIQCRVLDANTNDVMYNATLLYNNKEIIKNDVGVFQLLIDNSNSIKIQIFAKGYIGLDTVLKENEISKIIDFKILKGKRIKEIKIKENDKIKFIEQNQLGLVNIPTSTLKKIPSIAGEKDLLKALQFTPGINFGNEGSSNLIVRGGSADQNLILVDGTPLYNINHIFGFLSIIPSDAIKNLELYKSGFPSKYGGRLSSIVDIKTKDGSTNNKSAGINLGILCWSGNIDMPLLKNKLGLYISTRTTAIDKGIQAVNYYQSDKKNSKKTGFGFYDLVGKLKYIISPNDRIFISSYIGSDNFLNYNKSTSDFVDTSTILTSKEFYNWGNQTASIRWNHIFNSGGFINASISTSNYKYNRGFSLSSETLINKSSVNSINGSYNFITSINSIRSVLDFSKQWNSFKNIQMGIVYDKKIFNPEIKSQSTNSGVIDTLSTNFNISNNEFDFYVSNETNFKKLNLVYGIRYELFITDNYKNNNIQPRVNARYILNKNSSIKFSYAKMAQHLHLLTSSGIGLSTDTWVPAIKNAPSEISNQFSIGYFQLYKGWNMSVETYYKTLKNVLEYKEGVSYLNTLNDWRDKITVGNGIAKGIEFSMSKEFNKIDCWLNYTLSNTNRLFNDLNEGKTFPFKYDKRHVINAFLSYERKENKFLTLTWTFASGSAYTLPEYTYPQAPVFIGIGFSSDFIQNNDAIFSNNLHYTTSRNNMRVRPYHRLDVGYAINKKKKYGEKIISFNIINMYARRNPFYIFIKEDKKQKTLTEFSLFSIIPSVSIEYKFIKKSK